MSSINRGSANRAEDISWDGFSMISMIDFGDMDALILESINYLNLSQNCCNYLIIK